jgi:molybdopterin converting factor small subunit
MARVHLPSQLRNLAGGSAHLDLAGTDVSSVLAELERAHPSTVGWVTDERGTIRRHIKVFVNGEEAELKDKVTDGDEIRIIPSISGGSDDVELLVGTHKGLFILRGERDGELEVAARAFEGAPVEYTIRDPRDGTYLASVTHPYYGPKVWRTDDPAGEWEQSDGPAFPEDTDAAVERIWMIQPGEGDGVLWAGVAPAALFRSDDGGRSWSLNRPLWDVPGREGWQGGAGGLCLHSICPWPGDPDRIAVGISAAGVWISEDAGRSWRWGVKGLIPGYLPEEARSTTTNFCVHDLQRMPRQPDRLYMQFHGGVYRSDDAGDTWVDIGSSPGLVSDFGFPLVVDPADPERAFVIPLTGAEDRVTPDGRVAVYETGDSGSTWNARTEGLPQEDAYLTILRQAFSHDGRDPLGLYFGATSGAIFGSPDGGSTWRNMAKHLPPILSVRCA